MKWISIEDRLPEGYTHCLVVYGKKEVGFHVRPLTFGGNKVWYEYCSIKKIPISSLKFIVRWQLFPKPPKE